MTKAEKHLETLKDLSLPLPIWCQDRLTNQWKSKKLILQEKGYTSISPDRSNKLTWLPLQKIQPKGAPNIQTRDKTSKTPGEKKFQYKPWRLLKCPKYATLNVTNLMISLLGDR